MYREKSVGAVVFTKKDDKVYYLLLKAKYKREYWELPKGLIEPSEKLRETAQREVREETGLENFEIIDGFKENISYVYRREGRLVQKEVTYLLIRAKDTNVKISSEHIGYEWVEYEEAKRRLKDKLKLVIEKANQFILENVLPREKTLLDYFSKNQFPV